MRIQLLITILIIPIVLSINPVKANSGTFFTGGGMITEGCDENASLINFAVFAFNEGYTMNDGGGYLQINFDNTHYSYLGDDHFDGGEFIATYFSSYDVEVRQIEYPKNSGEMNDFTFVRLIAEGSYNGQPDWSVHLRFSDSGHLCEAMAYPCKSEYQSFGAKTSYRRFTTTDAVRIQIYNAPYLGGDLVYDTASGPEDVYDFPREHSWRTFFDVGNVTVFNLD